MRRHLQSRHRNLGNGYEPGVFKRAVGIVSKLRTAVSGTCSLRAPRVLIELANPNPEHGSDHSDGYQLGNAAELCIAVRCALKQHRTDGD